MISGEVQVPYTSIEGNNVQIGVSLYNMNGSTDQHIPEGQISTKLGVKWSLPGGITNGGSIELGHWGYAIYTRLSGATETLDDDVYDWLKAKYRAGYEPRLSVEIYKAGGFTEAEIDAGSPEVINAVNNMVKQYINHLQNEPLEDFNKFKEYFGSCTYPAV